MRKRFTLVIVTALLLGTLLGAAAGFYWGLHEGASVMIDRSLARDARSVDTLVGALGRLRAGRTEEGIGTIERHVEDTLVLFDPHDPYPGVSPQTRAAVEEALATARRYREAYPRAAPRPAIDPMVDNLLDRDRAGE